MLSCENSKNTIPFIVIEADPMHEKRSHKKQYGNHKVDYKHSQVRRVVFAERSRVLVSHGHHKRYEQGQKVHTQPEFPRVFGKTNHVITFVDVLSVHKYLIFKDEKNPKDDKYLAPRL